MVRLLLKTDKGRERDDAEKAIVLVCNRIPEASFPLLEGLEVLILGALRFRPHATHFTVAEAEQVGLRALNIMRAFNLRQGFQPGLKWRCHR